jgi:hypothetical protein
VIREAAALEAQSAITVDFLPSAAGEVSAKRTEGS